MREFPTPHCHVQSLDSASTPEAFAKKEVELGTGVLTCTDHGSLGAAYKCYDLAKKNNLIFACGCEGYFRDDNCPILTKLNVPKTATIPRGSDKDKWAVDHPNGSFFDYNKYFHVTLGFQDYNAYLKGVKLLSKADDRAELHGSERKPLFDWNDIEELASVKTTLGSGCLVGMISRHLIKPSTFKLEAAKAYFERLLHLFKDRFFVELFPHVCSHNYSKCVVINTINPDTKNTRQFKHYFGKTVKVDNEEIKAEDLANKWNAKNVQHLQGVKNFHTWESFDPPLQIVSITKQDGFYQNECDAWAPDGDLQWGCNRYLMGMAKKYKVPILISDDSHFTDPEQKIVQNVRLAQMGNWQFYSSYHRQSSSEAYSYFKSQHQIPESVFEGWIDNGYKWAEGFKDFEFDTTIQLPYKFFPQDTLQEIKRLIKKNGRMPNNSKYFARLKQELDLFHKNGKTDLLSYFLLASETTDLYSRQGVLTGPGRGSSSGTLLAYLLGITHVDPLKYDLSLDRFLTLDRINSNKYPDIDQDFPFRDFLCGYETDVVEFEAVDGTKHTIPESFKLETDKGSLTVKEAIEQDANIKGWW